jgi:hypothetical protein
LNKSKLGKRSQLSAEKVAEKMGLTTVKQVQFEKEFNLKELRTEIKRILELPLNHLKRKSLDACIMAMETNGVEVIPTTNNQNKLQRFRFEFNGHNLKSSDFYSNL